MLTYSGYLRIDIQLLDFGLVLANDAENYPVDVLSQATHGRRIIYLHVGKTGGSTTKGALRIHCTANKWRNPQRKQCRKDMQRMFRKTGGEGALSKHVIGYSHVNLFPKETVWQRSNSFLFSVRNPINRFISWYDQIYDKMCRRKTKNGKCDYKFSEENGEVGRGVFQCFSEGIESLAQSLTPKPLYPEQRLCWRRAWQIFQTGPTKYPSWMWHVNPYNYQHYAEQSIRRFPEKDVFAIRTESLWSDIVEIDHLLGGNGTGFRREQVNKGKRKLSLSKQSKTNLCCALVEELEIYEEVLRRAINIDEADYFLSMAKVLSDCGGPLKPHVEALINSTSDGSYLRIWANRTACARI